MKRIDKNFLGGIFNRPTLKDLIDKFRGKFGYLPREESIENLVYPSDQPRVPPYMPPKVYPILRIRSC